MTLAIVSAIWSRDYRDGLIIKGIFSWMQSPRRRGPRSYTIAHSDGPGIPHDVGPHELVFRSAATQRVSTTWTFNDLGSLSRYEGWEAIKILSPNPMESSHTSGGFSLNCPPLAQAANGVRVAPIGGRFLGSLNGFHVNRQTRDDALERDGPGDEVFIRDANFIIDAAGHVNNFSFSGSGVRSFSLFSWHSFLGANILDSAATGGVPCKA